NFSASSRNKDTSMRCDYLFSEEANSSSISTNKGTSARCDYLFLYRRALGCGCRDLRLFVCVVVGPASKSKSKIRDPLGIRYSPGTRALSGPRPRGSRRGLGTVTASEAASVGAASCLVTLGSDSASRRFEGAFLG